MYRNQKSYRTKSGLASTPYWQARIPLTDGKHRMANFSVRALGEEEAKTRAIVARLRGLEALGNTVFRATRQPQPVSTMDDIAILEATLRAPLERRVLRDEEREAKRAQREKRLAEVREEMTVRAATKNATGEPYIGRYQNTRGTGQYWQVSIIRKGVRYRKNFSDSVFSGSDEALSAAKTWRDATFLTLPGESMATVVARVKSTNTSGVPGVTRAKAERNGQLFHYWVANSPKVKGQAHRSKRFSISKFGDKAAFELATNARAAFVEELRHFESHHHRAARQMQNSLRGHDEMSCQ